MESERDRFLPVLEVLENDHGRVGGDEFETIGVEGAEDSDAFECHVAQRFVLDSILCRRTEQHLDESTSSPIE